MTNSFKFLLALSLLAGLSACGDDSNSPSSPVDAGPGVVLKPVDAGTTPVTSTPTTDAGPVATNPSVDGGAPAVVTPGLDGGTGTCDINTSCPNPKTMDEFLNRNSSAQTTTKTLAIPANLLTPAGDVMPL